MVTAIEDIFKEIKEYTTNQPSTGIIGVYKNTTTIFNHAEFPNDVKYRYLDEGNPNILMTGATMKPFDTGSNDPLDHTVNTTMTQ